MWWVDIGSLQNIHHVIIQYATGNQVWDEDNYQSKYFLGFSVYVSPTPSKEDGVLCFRDTNYTRATIPNPVNITCPYPGRYVIYYNNRTHKPFPDGYSEYAYNDLCEVEVYGCRNLRHYGTNCSIPCPRNCLYGVCDIINGDCTGCVAGYKGRTCNEECNNHKYGLMCKQTCGSCYGGKQCDHVNGSCTNGCEAGLFGDKCDEECLPGVYGNNCQNKCSMNCGVPESCDRKFGECAGGCQKGWLKPNCVTKCHSGTYGQDCTQSCGECIAKEACHYITGACMNGCERGYQGMECKTGPKQSSVTDFWAMIWQENVTQIVMLTNLKEGVKVNCTQYWPENMKARVHGDFVIKNTKEKEYAFYVIRKLTLLSLKKQKKSRVVTQYHYTTWPEHGTPDPLSLVVFHNHVLRTGTNQENAPVVVHCSAGIGRTGTYIALDALYKGGKTTGKINVAEYVKVMRSNRMNMVQTYEQNMVIFLALNEKFKADVKPQRLSDFTENVESLIGDVPANQTVIRKQFEKLLQIRPEYSRHDYKNAIPHASNPNDTVLPLDKFCLYLTSSVGKRGSYINAISVSSFLKNNAFIVSQYPTPEDAVDFLRLLTDHESDTVICLNPLHEIKSSKSWFPSREASKSVVPFTVQYESENESDTDVKITNIKVLNEENQSHPVVVIEPKGPLRADKETQDTSCLRNLVSYSLNISTESPLTILSKDGASLCGVFCAVFNCIQQINMDDSVDVFTTVRQLQTRRPEFCSTQDEFLLVYKTVRDYVETTSENVYFNQ
uniref:Receptor-type tyrosine-protein phosphatase gamma-like n=1 Tax=Crassostrea virginica TaxID=6565 RepID=A0A8B8BWD0_CRAVI|nr:receptor-type tyrosine-protein phosphatase gamma-like [Crassostrea virginica]